MDQKQGALLMGYSDTSLPRKPASTRDYMSGAYLWLLVFFVVYCARPEDFLRLPLPVAKITGFLAIASFGLVVMAHPEFLRLTREMKYLSLMVLLFFIGIPFSSVWRGGAFNNTLEFAKVLPIILLLGIVANTLVRLKRLIFVQTASIIMMVLFNLIQYRFHASEDHRLGGTLGGIYGNPNDLALCINMALPYCAMFMMTTGNIIKKVFWALAMVLLSYALPLTYSRAGLLGFIVAGFVMLWEFGVKGKRYALLATAGLVLVGLLAIAGPKGYLNRAISIVSPSADAGKAEGSWRNRQALLIKSLEVTATHPLFGVGCGNFEIVSGDWHVAHNSYTELSADGGVIILVLYLMILWRTNGNFREIQRLAAGQPDLILIGSALRASFAAFLVGSFFVSVSYHYYPYFLVAYSGALLHIASKRANPDDPAPKSHNVPKPMMREPTKSQIGQLIGTRA